MTIDEAKKEKELLEDNLTKVIHDFQIRTGLSIDEVKQFFVGTTITVKVKIKL